MQEVFIDTGDVNLFISSINNLIATQTENAVEVNANISSSARHVLANLTSALYQEANSDLIRAQTSVKTFLKLLSKQQNLTNILRSKYISLDIPDLIFLLSDLNDMVGELDYLCEAISTASSELSSDTEFLTNLTSLANRSFSVGEMTVARAQMLLFLARDDIQALTQIIGDLQVGSGDSASGDLVSGSGANPDEPLTVLPDSDASIATGISDLTETTEQLTQLLLVHNGTVNTAADTSLFLQAAHFING